MSWDSKAYHKRYYTLHKEKIKQRSKQYYADNQEHCRRQSNVRYHAAPEKSNDYVKRRKKKDPAFRLKCGYRTRVWMVLRGKIKSGPTLALLGCSGDFLKKHLENQFLPGMVWENYGKWGWHIDHKRPCASFDLTQLEQQKQCFHYTNLQPLWAKDNHSKGAKIV